MLISTEDIWDGCEKCGKREECNKFCHEHFVEMLRELYEEMFSDAKKEVLDVDN